MSLITATSLCKTYTRGAESVFALQNVSLNVEAGEFISIVGQSGAGKSTLLQLLGAMDRATSGELHLDGENLSGLSDAGLTRLRRESIGFVFQHFGLLPVLTAEENVALPKRMGRQKGLSASDLLEQVGLSNRRHHKPTQLSGGEMQRVAIARALVNQPKILLADEPTGNLDTATSDSIFALFRELNQTQRVTVILVTHNLELAERTDRRILLQDGRVAEDAPTSRT